MPVKKRSLPEVSTDAFIEIFKLLEKEEKSLSEIEIPDPNQLSIPSELVIRGDFTDRINALMKRRNITLPGILSDIETGNIGSDIVLSQLLKQLDALPAKNLGDISVEGLDDLEGNLFVPLNDIMRFFNKEDTVSRLDLALGRLRSGRLGPITDTEL